MQVVIPFDASWMGRHRGRLLWAEYALLLAGLAALDYYIWINARAELSQAYENWSFSQELQGQQVTFGRFIEYEIQRLLGRDTRTAAPASPIPLSVPRAIEQPPKRLPAAPPLAESSVVGRMEIPRLGLNLM